MSNNQSETQPKVLFVDDEPNVLKAIKRALFKMDVELLFADSGAKAIELLKQHPMDVVVSDMKMPEMNGAQLLAETAKIQPHTFRVVLTGFSDIAALQDAINLGKAHRFLNKPWDIDELKEAIREGSERSRLRIENSRLQLLTEKQNAQLKGINSDLEKKVQLRTKQIKQALMNIRRRSSALEKVLYNVIVIHPLIDGEFARLVSSSALALAEALKLEENEIDNIRLAALLCEIGKLGLSPELVRKNFYEMNYEEQKMFEQQVEFAKEILAPAVGLDACIDAISMQFEELAGTLKDIPLGSKVIAICRDYWRFRLGRMTGTKLSSEDTVIELRKYIGAKYDSKLLEVYEGLAQDNSLQLETETIYSSQLEPGAELAADLYNEKHLLLLQRGHVFTEQSIEKIRQFEKGAGTSLNISVKPSFDSDQDG